MDINHLKLNNPASVDAMLLAMRKGMADGYGLMRLFRTYDGSHRAELMDMVSKTVDLMGECADRISHDYMAEQGDQPAFFTWNGTVPHRGQIETTISQFPTVFRQVLNNYRKNADLIGVFLSGGLNMHTVACVICGSLPGNWISAGAGMKGGILNDQAFPRLLFKGATMDAFPLVPKMTKIESIMGICGACSGACSECDLWLSADFNKAELVSRRTTKKCLVCASRLLINIKRLRANREQQLKCRAAISNLG